MNERISLSVIWVLALLIGVVCGVPERAIAYDVGDSVDIDQVGEVVDVLRLGFWHWAHASGDPDPNDMHEGITDADDSVGDHQCTFTTTPYSQWDPVAEDYGASHWPFTFDPGNEMTCVMTAPEPGQYLVVFQALVHENGNYFVEYDAGGQWTLLGTFAVDPIDPDQYQTRIYAFVVETDPGRTQIPLKFYSTGHKLSLSGILLAKLAEDPFAGSSTSGYYHGNLLFDKSQASDVLARITGNSFLNGRYLGLLGMANVSNMSKYDAGTGSIVQDFREKLLANVVLGTIRDDSIMRNRAITLIQKPLTWDNWENFGSLLHGSMLRTMSVAYDYLYDHLTEAQRDNVRRLIDRQARRMYIESLTQDWWSPDGRANNWQAVTHSGLGLAGLVLREESTYAAHYLDWAKYQCKLYVKTTLTESGSCREAYGSYYTYGTGNITSFFIMLKNATGEDLLGEGGDYAAPGAQYIAESDGSVDAPAPLRLGGGLDHHLGETLRGTHHGRWRHCLVG